MLKQRTPKWHPKSSDSQPNHKFIYQLSLCQFWSVYNLKILVLKIAAQDTFLLPLKTRSLENLPLYQFSTAKNNSVMISPGN